MNPYKELNIPKDATQKEIRAAYKEKAKTHHPDRGGSADQFKKFNECYQVLISTDRRRTYDETGQTEEISIDAQVSPALMGLFSEMMMQDIDIDHSDIFKTMESVLNQKISSLRQQTAGVNKGIKKHEKVRSRIKKGAIFQNLIDDKLKGLRNHLLQIEAEIKLNRKMISQLQIFEYEVEQRPGNPHFGNMGSYTFTQTSSSSWSW